MFPLKKVGDLALHMLVCRHVSLQLVQSYGKSNTIDFKIGDTDTNECKPYNISWHFSKFLTVHV